MCEAAGGERMTRSPSLVIEGCQDVWEELALTFCRGSEQAARDLVRRQSLVAQRNAAQARLPEANRAVSGAIQGLAVVRADYDRVAGSPNARIAYGICGLVALGGLTLLFVPNAEAFGLFFLLGAAGGAGVFAMSSWHKLTEAREKVNTWEAEVGRHQEAAEALKREIAAVTAEVQSIQPRTPVRAVGRVYLPATVELIGGYGVAMDRSGVIPPASFRLADFTYDSSELAHIVAAIEQLKHPPVMLQPAEGEGADRIDALHGEEVILRDTVTRFARFVGSVPTTDVALPLVPSAELARVGFRLDGGQALPFPGAVLGGSRPGPAEASIRKLNETLGSVRRQGAAPKEELQRSYRTIASLLRQYRDLRTTSMGQIHEQLLGAMSRSQWCGVHFYCPKATRNPHWIQRRLGIDIGSAHEMPQDVLMRSLVDDDEIGPRIAARPELVDRLDRAWVAIAELDEGVEALRSAAAVAAGGVGVAASASAATYSGTIRGLNSQREQLVLQYRDVLREIMFGSRQPLIEMSSLPRLTLDPDTGVWRNETAGTEYADFAEIECTQVLRVHEDLLFPIWRHLWTEKADFRKSELFRTNEQLLRLSEKESEKLISIGNQFRDDMRTTREVLKQVEGELKGKLDQMRGTREALKSLNLLGTEGMQTLGEASMGALDVGAAGVLAHAEVKETILALEPQAQTERRERATDPIDQIARPEILFQASPADWYRTRLAAGERPAQEAKHLTERVVIAGISGAA